MGVTSIEWTDRSINPIRARRKDSGDTGHYCEKVSPGCLNCYSSRFQPRFHMPTFGGKSKGPQPLVESCRGHGGEMNISASNNIEVFMDPKRLLEVRRARVPAKWFWCDMSDLFGEWVPDAWIARCFAVMVDTPNQTHQVLTKRAERMSELLNSGAFWKLVRGWLKGNHHRLVTDSPLSDEVCAHRNIWLGTSVENQDQANKRVPHLLRCPVADGVVRFISQEPQLEAIDYNKVPDEWDRPSGHGKATLLGDIDWVIQGGESGPGARPFNIEWARFTRDQCRAAGVAYFLKQLGSQPRCDHAEKRDLTNTAGCRVSRFYPPGLSRKGGNMAEWPEDLRVREMPGMAR